MIRRIKNIIKKILLILSRIFPIDNNKIIVDNFIGKGYGDNPKYIVEELHRRSEKYKIVWTTFNIDEEFPDFVIKVKYGSFRAIYEWATAKVWISNVRNTYKPAKRKSQIYLQTWHGSYGPKKCEKDVENTLNPDYVKAAKNDGKELDGILSNSFLLDEIYIRAFWLKDNSSILRFGFPRMDLIIANKDNTEMKNRIRSGFKITDDELVILYSPTFRDDLRTDGYKLDFDKIINAFENKYSKRVKMLVRLHPNVQNQSSIIDYNDKLLDATYYPDMQELYLASDFLISDYSSAFLEYVLLERPAFICALDLDSFEKKRELDYRFKSGFLPFPFSSTNQELLESIENFDYDDYSEKVKVFFGNYQLYDKGNASEKTAEWIENKLKEK